MSNPPEEPKKRLGETVGSLMIKTCSSCYFISGGGLMLAGAYVYSMARRTMKPGHLVKTGTFVQLHFSTGLIAWGLVIMSIPFMPSLEKKDP